MGFGILHTLEIMLVVMLCALLDMIIINMGAHQVVNS